MTRVVRAAAVMLLALLAAGCGAEVVSLPASDTAAASRPVADVEVEPPPDQRVHDDALQGMLDQVAAAFLAADREAVRPHLIDPGSAFGQRWLARADNLAEVPLTTYRLELQADFPDLATGRVRDRFAEDVEVRYVVEEHALEGFDASGPAAEDLFLTFVRTDGGWRVAADTDAEPLGLVSADHLWDHGPVVMSVDGPLAALHHPGTASVPEVLREARVALSDVQRRWPLEWPGRVPIIVPRDEDELAELLHVTFDLSSFVAFATATPVGELGEYELTGTRVILNPARFLNRSSETRQLILAHELLHVATRPVAGPFTPAWVEEGIAQRLGEERSTTGLRLLDGVIARGAFAGELPLDAEFTTGGRDRIFLSYQLAYSFLDYLVDAYGAETVARWYAELGQGSIGEPGREEWHVRRAIREVFGQSLDELRRAWAAAVS